MTAPKRVLLVEDDETNQLVAIALLEDMGHSLVTVAANGREALDLWARGGFDVILMDCCMPVMDGYEATAALRRMGCDVPIIALTASTVPGDRQRCLSIGMDDYLSKPVNPVQFETCMALWLGTGDATAAAAQAAPAEPVVFDAELTLERFLGNSRLLGQATEAFFAQAPRSAVKLADCLATADATGAREAAHALKGSAATIGANQVAATAGAIEQLALSGQLTSALAALTGLEQAMARFSGLVRPHAAAFPASGVGSMGMGRG